MTYEEQDYGKVIIEKLEAIEDFLKSFMPSLQEPHHEKGRRVRVRAGVRGRIIEWTNKKKVEVGDLLCTIQTDIIDPDPWNIYKVYARVSGTLYIRVASGLVNANTVIAEIEPDTAQI
ncbi:MAG: hypothetical protein ACE5KK_03145 [Candidatus Brocadiales bacterium]